MLSVFLLIGCQDNQPISQDSDLLFHRISAEQSGISFRNDLFYTEEFNPYTYRNFYNGGGVGVGDVNKDGLIDLYFCGNLADNQLYLNRGDFAFEDITAYADVACAGVWSSGVSFVDVNGDGWLDIYVCKSGAPGGDNRHNELFINNADPDEEGRITFSEKSEAWGVDALGLSTHAAFFDYDRDGDLDMYLLSNSIRSVGGYDLIKDQRLIRDSLGGNKLFRHDGDHFTDVSEEAGIYGSAIGFGLGVTIGDVNRDGWPDIYVSNDFFERDYLYLNQQDGTFREQLPDMIRELSLSSMGADLGDLNNDGFPEIFVTDMLPEGDARMKTKTAFEDWDKYQLNVRQGYHHQFIRNVLQLNNQNGTFAEIGRMAGTYATDWSWGALMFDFDNDGYRDIFVANGIYKDLTDQDYIKYFASPYAIVKKLKEENAVIEDLIDGIPSEAVANYAFVNQGTTDSLSGLWAPTFKNEAAALGLGEPSFSNGSAYADFDNDGDLDLVINNVNMEPFLYRNQTEKVAPDHHWIRIVLEGEGMNQFGLGAQVRVVAGHDQNFQELHPMRGFESCVDSRLLFGIGTHSIIDTLEVAWPDGRRTVLTNLAADQTQTIRYVDAKSDGRIKPEPRLLFSETEVSGLMVKHQENDFNEFTRERLLFHMNSAEGPAVAWGDVNGDGLEDVFVGGAVGQAGQIFVQQPNGRFVAGWKTSDPQAEEVDAVFFDADNDGKLDLYVCHGGGDLPANSLAAIDALYLNKGAGSFVRSTLQLVYAGRFINSGCVAAGDLDGDGDTDLFVGERLRPSLYGVPGDGLLLINDGKGTFSYQQDSLAPAMKGHSLFTDATWTDLDSDGDLDLVTVGEWSPATIWINEGGHLAPMANGLDQLTGWWNTVEVADLNGDGLKDLVLGNHGLNSRFRGDLDHPVQLFVNDFDGNGSAEQLVTVFQGDTAYPLVLRQDLVKQLPGLSRKYPSYASYRLQSMEDMFPVNIRRNMVTRSAAEMRSGVAYQQPDGSFRWEALPLMAQIAPVQAIVVEDVNADGRPDLILAGNFHKAKPEVGIYDANDGQLWLNMGQDAWQLVPDSGINIRGVVASM
ncbi:MAG: VCBS repeat-containing protein, partial [Bacteroidia bacterium]|nr:VCBS repeat-containing protein [Bacteroidia bacterium]